MDDKSGFTEQMPQTIGRYQVQESVGYGAMGAVYKAFDPLIKRTLAIKTIRLDIPKQSPQYKSFIERFYHEARISGTLSHPNIVTLFDIGEEGGIPYLAMEFVEGETIASLIEKGVRFPPEKVIGLISQIASAVDYAHSRGVIHRDIKPSNLILFEGDRVKVTDFGIAKLVDAEMTQSGTLLGTPSYMSPEQAMGDKLDGRSDIFSLGVCAFEMLSGEQPFPGNNVTSILYKLVHVDPIEPPNLEMHGLVPQRWHEVFGRVLAKKPDERYQTATEFVQDLEYCLGSWFGAAMDTVADGSAMPSLEGDPDGESVTRAIPRIEEEAADQATTALPAVAASRQPVSPPTVRALVPEEDSPETVSLQAPSEQAIATAAAVAASAANAERTVVLRADQLVALAKAPPPPAPGRTEKPTTGPAEKTILMKASDLPPAPPKARPAGAAASASPPPAPPPEKTVLMASPAPAAKGSAELPTLRPTNELTVKTPSLSAPTVRATVPAGSRTIPPLPKQAEPPRPVPAPPASLPPIPKAPPPPKPLPVPVRPAAEELPEVTETTRRPGVSAGLVLGLSGFAAVLLFAAIAVWAYRTLGGSEAAPPAPTTGPEAVVPTPTPTPAPSVATPSADPPPATAAFPGALHVETQPTGAAVIVNGEARGMTPLDLTDLAEGAYQVRLELKGYDARTQSVTLTADAPRQEVKVSMQKAGPAMGLADILSTPFGAAVTVDGNAAGVTPLTDFKAKVGNHPIEITKEGYEAFSATLKIEAGKRVRVDALLRAVVKATPAPPPADKVDPTKVYEPRDVDTQPKRLSGGSAPYPDSAPRMRSGDSVSVSLSFVISEDGEVTDIKVTESGGKMVDEAVMAAVRNWKYSPGIKKGVKVKVRSGAKQTFRAG